MADFKFVDEKHPEGFAWNKFKIKVEGDRADLVIPCLVSWGKNVAEPEVDDSPGARKKGSASGECLASSALVVGSARTSFPLM